MITIQGFYYSGAKGQLAPTKRKRIARLVAPNGDTFVCKGMRTEEMEAAINCIGKGKIKTIISGNTGVTLRTLKDMAMFDRYALGTYEEGKPNGYDCLVAFLKAAK